jgi:uncharacterized protein YcbX
MRVGQVQSIHRFPVKSMAGEQLTEAKVGLDGIVGDRAFAVRDEAAGEIRGGRQLPKLMMCSAHYLEQPTPESTPAPAVQLPDGSLLRADDPELARRVSGWLGREVTIWPRVSASNKQHYRRARAGASLAGTLARSNMLRKVVSQIAKVGPAGRELREELGRAADEPMPDLTVLPAEIFEYVSPPGTYFDVYPLHLVTTATLDALRAKQPDGDWDRRRFRPNFVIETEPSLEGLVEAGWEGRELRVGSLRLACTVATFRCSMIGQPQPELVKDTSLLRTVVREANQCVGIYARVLQAGSVVTGDAVELA